MNTKQTFILEKGAYISKYILNFLVVERETNLMAIYLAISNIEVIPSIFFSNASFKDKSCYILYS